MSLATCSLVVDTTGSTLDRTVCLLLLLLPIGCTDGTTRVGRKHCPKSHEDNRTKAFKIREHFMLFEFQLQRKKNVVHSHNQRRQCWMARTTSTNQATAVGFVETWMRLKSVGGLDCVRQRCHPTRAFPNFCLWTDRKHGSTKCFLYFFWLDIIFNHLGRGYNNIVLVQ